MPGSLLVAENLGKVYPGVAAGVVALAEVSFTIQRGEFVALRGPSGCGKSTLLHILGAMDRPTQGSVTLAGRDLSSLGAEALAQVRRRQVGFVFQSYFLLPTLRVAENVMLPLLLEGTAASAARQRAEELLQVVGLEQRGGHFPGQLSGGEMQRAAVARAVAHRPELLLADEPTGNLDSGNGRRVMELLSRLHCEFGLTIVLATHADEAAAYTNRTIALRDGRVVL